MAKRDYYKVLDVPKTATEAEIKKAYRRLAMKYHPDRNPNDRDAEESFKEAKEACEVLTDPHKRAAYDQYGHAGVEAAARGGAGARGGFGADAFSDIFGDVFGDIFGGARRGGRSQVFRGADLRYELELDLPQAVFGHQVEIEVTRLCECEVCHGSGAAKGSTPATCDTCGGAGQVRISQGFFQLQQTCPRCRGAGTIVRNPCDSLPRPGARAAQPQAVGEGPGGCRYRRSGASQRRGRGRTQWRSAGRPVCGSPRARASDFRARRGAPELRGAGELRDRCARWHGQRADARWRRDS